jgi:hypothetical protein
MRRRWCATLGSLAAAAVALQAGAAGEAGAPAAAVRCAATAAPSLRDAASNLSVVRAATRRAARRDALGRCRSAIAALPLPAGGKVGDALPHDRALGEAVEAALRRARLAAAPRYFADGGVALEYEVRLDGALGERLAAPEKP